MVSQTNTLVTVHFAQSLDGRIATRTGKSQWLSGDESLGFAHRLRAEHDAVLVGIGTVLADDPRLTVRHVEGKSPTRVVLDSRLRIPLVSRCLADRTAETIIATSRTRAERLREPILATGAKILDVPEDKTGRLDLHHVLRGLDEMGIRSVLVEGGRGVITSFLQLSLVDRFLICIAPKLVGTGIDAVGDLGVEDLSDALTFERASFQPLGADVIFDGTLRRTLGEGPPVNPDDVKRD